MIHQWGRAHERAGPLPSANPAARSAQGSPVSLWSAVIVAGLLAWATKFAGYLVPQRWLGGPRVGRMMDYLPVALLAALVAVQTFDSGGALRLDARAAGLLAAVLALLLRAPFLLVIVIAAATAAALRALGVG